MGRTQTIYLLILTFSILVSFAKAQEESPKRLGFLQQLQAEEDAQYAELIENIKSMNDSEYHAFLNNRIENAFNNPSTSLSAMIVVDVTDEMSAPEPNFFMRLFAQPVNTNEFGVKKIESTIESLNLKDNFHNSSTGSNVTFQSAYESVDGDLHYQRLGVRLNQELAYSLVGQEDLVDLVIVENDDNPSQFITTDTSTGRILPRQVQKIYDQEFIDNGLYNELIQMFASNEFLTVQVSFHEPEGYENTKQYNDQAELDVDIFLNSWPDYEFEVFHHSTFYAIMRTNKAHVEAMKADARVSSISKGSIF